jgi:hypothetical protein
VSPFLEPEDVERLTGYVMASKQLAWCKRNGIAAWLSARGQVVVPLAAVEGRKAANEERWRPDYTELRGGE